MLARNFACRSVLRSFTLSPVLATSSHRFFFPAPCTPITRIDGMAMRSKSLLTGSQMECRGKKKKGGKSGGATDSALEEMAANGVDLVGLGEKMDKTLNYLSTTLSALRSERISPSLIENILVELPLKVEEKKKKKSKSNTASLRNVADISILDHRNLVVIPHDEALEKNILKALNTAEGGFLPQPHEGNGIKVPVPKMTMEFREQLEKNVNKHAEDSKESLRRVRKEGMDQIKSFKSLISKDDAFRQEKKVKELLDKKTKFIQDLVTEKVREIKDSE